MAHVRGGSEYGDAWHQAAVRRGRATAAEDIVDVVKHLIRDGWASAGRVALTGTSCGGTTVGLAALDRPDLIAAASLHAGGVDEWRGWSETASGARSVLDIGDPETALGVRQIVAASAYHQILPGARLPGFLLLNGGTDYTIPLWMGAKFIARARAAAPGGPRPILFRVDRDTGHGGAEGIEAQADALADDLSFQLWQLGHPDFQPPSP
jgi:prolyl oligopeptidase